MTRLATIVISGNANRKAIIDLRRTNEEPLVRLPAALRRTSATASAIRLLSSLTRRLVDKPTASLGRCYPDSGSVACTLPQQCENASPILSCLSRTGFGASVGVKLPGSTSPILRRCSNSQPVAAPGGGLALGEFQLDAAVATISLLANAGVERLVVGE